MFGRVNGLVVPGLFRVRVCILTAETRGRVCPRLLLPFVFCAEPALGGSDVKANDTEPRP